MSGSLYANDRKNLIPSGGSPSTRLRSSYYRTRVRWPGYTSDELLMLSHPLRAAFGWPRRTHQPQSQMEKQEPVWNEEEKTEKDREEGGEQQQKEEMREHENLDEERQKREQKL